MVLDYVRIKQQNLGMITNWVRRCANTGTTITNEGIECFKVCEVATSTTNKEGEQVASSTGKAQKQQLNSRDSIDTHRIEQHRIPHRTASNLFDIYISFLEIVFVFFKHRKLLKAT